MSEEASDLQQQADVLSHVCIALLRRLAAFREKGSSLASQEMIITQAELEDADGLLIGVSLDAAGNMHVRLSNE